MAVAAPAQQKRAQQSRLRIFEAALMLFAKRGYEATTFRDIAKEADVSLGLVARYFPTRESISLVLYETLAAELESRVSSLVAGTCAERFRAIMLAKLEIVEPHRGALIALFAKAFDPSGRIGVLGSATAAVRSRVSGVFQACVRGATDAPSDPEAFARLLYGLHLGLILVWTQDGNATRSATHAAVELATSLLAAAGPLLALPAVAAVAGKADGMLRELFRHAPSGKTSEVARAVFARLLAHRRLIGTPVPGGSIPPAMAALHVPRIEAFVAAHEPIRMILPAFPAKSPNPKKVIGAEPDLAEELALKSLRDLTAEIREAHRPGATIVICSDGHVFADLVGVPDATVARYKARLVAMIAELDAPLEHFDLGDAFGTMKPAAARAILMERYARPREALVEAAKSQPALAAQIDGIHRFLTEDELGLHPELSKTAARKQTRDRAYEVVRRSEAWSRLLATVFPEALRLSIHPQPEVSDKIGIHLLPTEDEWLTPWHGAVLVDGERIRLVKRAEAEAAGARVVLDEDGRPSHLEAP